MMTDAQLKLDGGVIDGGLEALIRRAKQTANSGGQRPVEKWNPDYCGEIDMRIASSGLWYYMGTPIGRMPLVELFASVLRHDDDDRYYLVTPVEKIGIQVDDAPFLAVEMHSTGLEEQQVLTFRTTVGDIVSAGREHPLRFAIQDDTGGLKPYLHIRGRLEALLSRPLLYDLAKVGNELEVEGVNMYGVWSGGEFYPILPADELARLSEL